MFVISKEDIEELMAQVPQDVRQKLGELAEEEAWALFTKQKRGSDNASASKSDADAAAALKSTVEINHGSMGTLNGGGEKTLPPGFADNVVGHLSEILSRTATDGCYSRRIEKRMADIESKVRRAESRSPGRQPKRLTARLHGTRAVACHHDEVHGTPRRARRRPRAARP